MTTNGEEREKNGRKQVGPRNGAAQSPGQVPKTFEKSALWRMQGPRILERVFVIAAPQHSPEEAVAGEMCKGSRIDLLVVYLFV